MLVDAWKWWSFRAAMPPILATGMAFVYALYILSYPPKYKKLSLLLLGIPVGYAFANHMNIAPDHMLSDTHGRFMYIWFAHMSYEVAILEFAPAVNHENDGWKTRLKLAWRVLFDRNHRPPPEEDTPMQELKWKDSPQEGEAGAIIANPQRTSHTRGPPDLTHTATGTQYHHKYSYVRFTAHHLFQSILLISLLTLYEKFRVSRYGPPSYDFDTKYGSFFRRLPDSLGTDEIYYRAGVCFEWTVISLFEYEFYYSTFALLFVSILRFDSPSEWPLSLCGHLKEAWSMRRYWGKHWHNYIYISFIAHTKIVTRKWLGCKQGALYTRLLENTIVFTVSGLMHSAVNRQQDPNGDMWAIMWWYTAQMLPIVVESAVQHYWHKAKKRMGVAEDSKWMAWAERALGYAWVIWWFMWSVPKYTAWKYEWSLKKMLRSQEIEHGGNEKTSIDNDTD